MSLIHINGINLNVAIKGQGKPLILLHGVAGNLSQLHPLADRLSRNFKTIMPDCRGHGASDKPAQFALDDHIRDIVAILDHFKLQSASLLGVSMGSTIAQGVAITIPERIEKLVLTVPRSNVLTASFQRLTSEQAGLFDTTLTPDQFEAANKALEGFDFRNDLPKVKAKTLVISGKLDRLNPPDEGRLCAKLIPEAVFHELPRSGHAPLYEQPQAYLKLVEEFLLT